MTVAGSTFLPFILITSQNKKVRLVLRVYVVPNLSMGMFISQGRHTSFDISLVWKDGAKGPRFFFDFGIFGTDRYSFEGLPLRPLTH